jgi:signal transduction histidine kinase
VDAPLDSGCQDACFRIAQEALTNIVRYARAPTVTLRLFREGDWLRMLIRDDGIGFDADALTHSDKHRTHLGLIGMEERASLVGGHIEFVSTPGAGTEVKVHVPFRRPAGRGNDAQQEVRDELDSHVDR